MNEDQTLYLETSSSKFFPTLWEWGIGTTVQSHCNKSNSFLDEKTVWEALHQIFDILFI